MRLQQEQHTAPVAGSPPIPPPTMDALVEAVAQRVAELLLEQRRPHRLVTARELADQLGVSRDTVYRYKHELGAVRIGEGRRPRVRFDVDLARRRWTERNLSTLRRATRRPERPAPRRTRPTPTSSELLPIRR